MCIYVTLRVLVLLYRTCHVPVCLSICILYLSVIPNKSVHTHNIEPHNPPSLVPGVAAEAADMGRGLHRENDWGAEGASFYRL